MRVIDFGSTTALRSQTVWHALASAARADAGPTLSFVRPGAPYVCLGYHRDLAELDAGYCVRRQLPVLRRMVGGGPVYLDSEQMFFQIVLPARMVGGRRAAALSELLAPAVRALRRLGVDARLDKYGEIVVSQAKVCGHGAGQIGEGVAVVGNLITGFDHARATRVLALGADARGEVERLMRRHVAATPVDPGAWRAAMVAEYAGHFAAEPRPDRMDDGERRALRTLDEQLSQPSFVAGSPRPARPVRTVKVRAGVWVHVGRVAGRRVVVGVAGGVVESVLGGGPVGELVGVPLPAARDELARDKATAALAAAMTAADTEVTAA